MAPPPHPPRPGGVTLTWTELGAAGPAVVRVSGRAYERLAAARAGRPRCGLLHGALVVDPGGGPVLVEMTPVWGQPRADRGVVAEGPVGATWLGRSRLFRYEVRRWAGAPAPSPVGVVAVARPRLDDDAPRRVLRALDTVPTPTWGRAPRGAGEMWTSNSVVAWVLVAAGLDPGPFAPPPGWRAPGWDAGLRGG